MKPYTAGILQLDTGTDAEKNLENIHSLANQAAEEGVSLLCLPEWSDVIAAPQPPPQPMKGPFVQAMADLARKHKFWLHLGSFHEENAGEKPFNTSVLFSPEGDIAAVYRKLHLFDVAVQDGPSFSESASTCAGNQVVTLETPLGHLGFSICYDLRFPELYHTMALKGAQVLFVPACFTHHTGQAHWETLLRARAIENGCYVIAAAQTGEKPAYPAYGHSLIIDPWGTVLAQGAKQPGLLMASIDPDQPRKIRQQVPNLYNRRPELYHLS